MNSFFSFIINNTKNYKTKSIFSKIFLTVICILLIPIIVFNVFYYLNSSNALEKEFNSINEYNLKARKNIVEANISEAEYLAVQTSVQPSVENFFLSSKDAPSLYKVQTEIMDYTKQFIYVHSYIHSVYVYSERTGIVIENQNAIDRAEQTDDDWYLVYEEMGMNETRILHRKFSGKYPHFISVIRTGGISNVGKIGCVVVNIDVAEMNEDICNIDGQTDVYDFFVINEENEILYSNLSSALGEKGSKVLEMSEKSEKYIRSSVKSEKNNWEYICLMYADRIFSVKDGILRQTIISMLVMIILAFIVAIFISMHFFRPFHEILQVLGDAHSTDYEIRPKFKQNEIGFIIDSIRESRGKYSRIEAEFQYRIETLNKAQAAALQSQINPHFINNMLEVTNWSAIDLLGKNNKISAMIKALSNLLSVGLDFENYLIPVSEEMEHINLYSHLISLGYEENLDLSIELDEGIEKYKIIKLTLQPVLENTVHHGFSENGNTVSVCLRGEILEKDIVFTISDNGVGIEPEKLKDIQQALSGKEYLMKNNIGLSNVNKRIKLIFGEKYGLSIDSIYGEGTTVKLTFPKISDEDE